MTSLPERLGAGDTKRTAGTAVIEFILIFTLVGTLLFGAVEFVALLNNRLILESAARDGARRAAIAGGNTEYVQERIARQLELGSIPPERVAVSVDPWSAPYGHSIRVRLSYESPTITPIGKALVGSAIRLNTEVLTRSERIR